MNALRLSLPPKAVPAALFAFRHSLCRLLPHDYLPLGHSKDDAWLDGDVRPRTEIVICKRCLQVKRRPSHAK